MSANKEWAQAKLNNELEKAFNSEEGVTDLNLFYDKLFALGFSEEEAVDMIDEAVFYVTRKAW